MHKVTCAGEKNKATLQFYYNSKSVDSRRRISFFIETSPIVGEYYLVDYEGALFPCVVSAFNGNGSIKVRCFSKAYGPRGSTGK